MSETYVLTLTVPQRLLLLVLTRMAQGDREFLTRQLMPEAFNEGPRDFSMSAHNLVVTHQLMAYATAQYPPLKPVVASVILRVAGYGQHHPDIQAALGETTPLPTNDEATVSLKLAYAQRRRLARFAFFNILNTLAQPQTPHLAALIPAIIGFDALLPKRWSPKRQPIEFDHNAVIALAPVILAVAQNYPHFEQIFPQLLIGLKPIDPENWAILQHLYTMQPDAN